MKITLTFNSVQLTILHALLGQATTLDITQAITDNYEDLSIMADTPLCETYKRTIAFMNNHPTHSLLGDESGDLFLSLEDAMNAIGRNFRGNNSNEQ